MGHSLCTRGSGPRYIFYPFFVTCPVSRQAHPGLGRPVMATEAEIVPAAWDRRGGVSPQPPCTEGRPDKVPQTTPPRQRSGCEASAGGTRKRCVGGEHARAGACASSPPGSLHLAVRVLTQQLSLPRDAWTRLFSPTHTELLLLSRPLHLAEHSKPLTIMSLKTNLNLN